jgi:hypothetical protein
MKKKTLNFAYLAFFQSNNFFNCFSVIVFLIGFFIDPFFNFKNKIMLKTKEQNLTKVAEFV